MRNVKRINLESIGRSVTLQDISAYVQTLSGKEKITLGITVIPILSWVIVMAIVLVTMNSSRTDLGLNMGSFASILLGMIVIALAPCFIWINAFRKLVWAVRFQRFARDNQATFLSYDREIARHPGLIFNLNYSDDQVIREGVLFDNGLEIGNYQYYTGNGRTRQEHVFGYIKIGATRSLPHIVLDAKKKKQPFFITISEYLPTDFAPSQKITLEGDFNTYFTVYAPDGYATDALYLLTPDVMNTLLAYKTFDFELIDTSIYVYLAHGFHLADRTQVDQIVQLVTELQSQLGKQIGNYRDSRSSAFAANTVAIQGQRLKLARSPIVTLLLISVFVWIMAVVWRFIRESFLQ